MAPSSDFCLCFYLGKRKAACLLVRLFLAFYGLYNVLLCLSWDRCSHGSYSRMGYF